MWRRHEAIRVLLADDHTVVRKGLRLLLENVPEFQVIADASSGREAVALAEQPMPDVIVMDAAMPILNGIEAARQITARLPQTRWSSRACMAMKAMCCGR